MKPSPQYNAATVLEFYRRRLFRANNNVPSTHFTYKNIDIVQLFLLYKSVFPEEIQKLFEGIAPEELKQYDIPEFTIDQHSPLLTRYSDFDKYTDLYQQYSSSTGGTYDNKSLREEYLSKANALNNRITSDIKSRFNKIITSSAINLQQHVETLLFVCIYFYNLHWDTYGISFDGKVSEKNSIKNLKLEEQPFYYRAHHQAVSLSTLFYNYYKSNSRPTEVTIVVGGKPHIINDPILTDWVVKSLIDNISQGKLPLSMDFYGAMLAYELSKRDNATHSDLLKGLKKFPQMKEPTQVNEKRRVIRVFCLEIHKAFAYYMDSPIDTYTTEQLSIYIEILKLFKMEDLTKLKRKRQTDTTRTPRTDLVENRLRELLKRKES